MKPIAKLIGVLCLIASSQLMAADSLKVTTTIVNPPGGDWGTRYTLVIWIQNTAGAFVKTIGRWGNDTGPTDLPTWNAHNGGVKTVDGVTGATPLAGGTFSAVWKCTGANGLPVPNGIYSYNIEVSNKHSTVNTYAGYYVQGKISIDGSSQTRNGVDSVVNAASTYITNVIAQYISAAAASPTISLNPASLSFTATQGGSNPASQTVTVGNTGSGTLSAVSATLSYRSGQSTGWLQTTIGGTGNTQTITNTVSIGALTQGAYQCTVSVSSSGASNSPQKYVAAIAINSNKALAYITLSPPSCSLSVGKTRQFTATGRYSDSTTADITPLVTWQSTNTAILTVNATGLASGIAKGAAVALASLSGKTGNAPVTVIPPAALQTISITPAGATVLVNQTTQFTATGHYDDASTADITSTVAWRSSNDAVATVNSAGLATGKGQGTANIVALYLTVFGSSSLTVSPAAPQVTRGSNSSSNGFVFTYPSPLRGGINVKLEGANDLLLYVINTQGQTVRTFFLSKERRNYVWDAKDTKGANVPSGIYFLVSKNVESSGAPNSSSTDNRVSRQSQILLLR